MQASKGPDIGAPVTERFLGNMPLRISGQFELAGAVWVEPQPRPDETAAELCGIAIGIAQTHEKPYIIRKTTGIACPLI